jgi:hypothetical protein
MLQRAVSQVKSKCKNMTHWWLQIALHFLILIKIRYRCYGSIANTVYTNITRYPCMICLHSTKQRATKATINMLMVLMDDHWYG